MYNPGEIGIIVPFFNAEKYIHRCVKSIQKQTYPYYRAYFIDDGSTDRSVQILCEYKDPRFTVLRQEKKGVSAARNLGLKSCHGEYIAFMDVDDELRPDYLEKLIMAAEQHQIDIVLCNYYEQYANGDKLDILLPWADTTICHKEICDELIPQMIANGSVPPIPGSACRTLLRRTFWEKSNIWFHVDITLAEDLLFVIALYNRAEKIYILGDCLYAYHQNADSVVHRAVEFPAIRCRYSDLHKKLGEVLEKEGLMQKNQDRYWAHRFSDYTVTISALARQIKNPRKVRSALKKLRKELLCESVSFCQCTYLSKGRKLSLWMLKHRMYIPLLALYWIKEKYRLRHY